MRMLRRKPARAARSRIKKIVRGPLIRRRGVDPRLIAAGAGGMAVAYLFDPSMGRTRRSRIRQRLGGIMRGTMRRSTRAGRGIGARASGYGKHLTHLRQVPKDWDDVTLVQKVQSEALGGAPVPKGSISVDAHDGIVVLRGAVDDRRVMQKLERAVQRVPGVRGVDNLLHTPGEPAPNKEAALRTGRR